MDFENLDFAVSGNVATLTLNRPDAFNAFNVALAREVMEAATHCDSNPDIRAVLINATGRMFCAGGDLTEISGAPAGAPETVTLITTYLHAAIARFTRMNAPVIMAVQGAAAGAGMSLICGGDIVIAARGARFTMAYTAIGLPPDGGGSYFLPRVVGLRRAQELILTNRRLSADEALDWGLVTEVVADDELAGRAAALASDLASGPTLAYGAAKRLLADTLSNSLETQMELETRAIAGAAAGADSAGAIKAFLGKQTPTFSGR